MRAIKLALLAAALLAPGAASAADCDRACLTGLLDAYFAGLAAHDASKLPLAPKVRATQNSAQVSPGDGLWRRAGAVRYRLDAVDPVLGQAAANAVVLEDGKPVILFVRLGARGRAVDQIETIVVRQGEGQHSEPANLTGAPSLYEQAVPPNQRSPRPVMIAAANAYLDALATSGTADFKPPPLADTMKRVENGMATGGVAREGRPFMTVNEQLKRGFGPPGAKKPSLKVTDRRVAAVDEERGVVVIVGVMNLDLPPGMPDMPGLHAVSKQNRKQTLVEFFKVSGGLVQEIQAVMYDLDDPALQTTGWPAP